jgi:hypothetical protein
MNKDVEKMDKRIKEIVAESQTLVEKWKQADEIINQQVAIKNQIQGEINKNAGRIDEINQWKKAMENKVEAVDTKVNNKADNKK